jgi:hypothetical protein
MEVLDTYLMGEGYRNYVSNQEIYTLLLINDHCHSHDTGEMNDSE